MKKFLLSIFCLFSLVSFATAEEVTVKFSEQGFENAQEVTEMIINSNLTATFDKGGNSSTTPKYYNTGNAYRLYAKNTMTITANNGYTISFDSKGGTDVPAQTDLMYGDHVTEPEPPTREGYTFKGWYLDENCIYEWDFETSQVGQSMTLYADWEPNS